MPVKNIYKQTLKEYLKENGIRQHKLKSICLRTLKNIFKGSNDGAKYNKNYRGNKEYFPTETTISVLSLELEITYMELVKLIENQYKSNKKNKLTK